MSTCGLYSSYTCVNTCMCACNAEVWWPPWGSFLRHHLAFSPCLGLAWQAMLTEQQAQGRSLSSASRATGMTTSCHSPSSTLIFYIWWSNSGSCASKVSILLIEISGPSPFPHPACVLRAFAGWIPVTMHTEARSEPVERTWTSPLHFVFRILWLLDWHWKGQANLQMEKTQRLCTHSLVMSLIKLSLWHRCSLGNLLLSRCLCIWKLNFLLSHFPSCHSLWRKILSKMLLAQYILFLLVKICLDALTS